MNADKQLSKYASTLEDAIGYRSIVGALQYLTLIRLEIFFVVNKLCLFMALPTDAHWLAVKRLPRYVNGTLSYDVQFSKGSFIDLVAFSDVDWAGCLDDNKCTNDYCVLLGNSLVS